MLSSSVAYPRLTPRPQTYPVPRAADAPAQTRAPMRKQTLVAQLPAPKMPTLLRRAFFASPRRDHARRAVRRLTATSAVAREMLATLLLLLLPLGLQLGAQISEARLAGHRRPRRLRHLHL